MSPVISQAQDVPDDELQEVVVTASPYVLDIYAPVSPSAGGGGGVVTVPPPPPATQTGSSKSNASTKSQKQAVNCAIQFSANAMGSGQIGPAPGYTTTFANTSFFGWGTTNPEYPAVATNTNPYQPPIQNAGYVLIDGYTSANAKTTTIYYASVAYEAPSLGVSAQTNLVNTLVHEWWHEWNGPDESAAEAAGDAAQKAYLAAGGDKGPCNN
jgi:hypothetical protein